MSDRMEQVAEIFEKLDSRIAMLALYVEAGDMDDACTWMRRVSSSVYDLEDLIRGLGSIVMGMDDL